MKKIVIFLGIILIILLSVKNTYKTTECWWGVIYPSLSFVGIDNGEPEVKYEFALKDWFKQQFSFLVSSH